MPNEIDLGDIFLLSAGLGLIMFVTAFQLQKALKKQPTQCKNTCTKAPKKPVL